MVSVDFFYFSQNLMWMNGGVNFSVVVAFGNKVFFGWVNVENSMGDKLVFLSENQNIIWMIAFGFGNN